jgi:phospholipid transport system transporter-binding protein
MAARAPVASGAAPAAGSFQLLPAADGQLAPQGPLTFATARAAREVGRRAIAASAAAALEIDCQGISAADSAGLAVLIDWLSAAREAGHKLRFRGLPAGLTALARISEVFELLERGV